MLGFQLLIKPASPDNRERYQSDDQWDSFQVEQIQKVKNYCESYSKSGIFYRDIYLSIAAARREFAQNRKVEHADRYGRIRQDHFLEDRIVRESFYDPLDCQLTSNSTYYYFNPTCWKLQSESVIKNVERLCFGDSSFGNADIMIQYTDQDSRKVRKLSRIECYAIEDKKTQVKFVQITYANPQHEKTPDEPDDWVVSSQLFQAMLRADDLDSFLKAMANYLYYESHLLRCSLGSESILQIIVAGVSLFKEVELAFNQKLDIGWNFKALVTENTDDFCQWFLKNAFETKVFHKKNSPIITLSFLAEPTYSPPVKYKKPQIEKQGYNFYDESFFSAIFK